MKSNVYLTARPRIRTGDVLLWRRTWRPSNRLIAWMGGTEYCHASMAVWWRCVGGRGVLMCVDTVQGQGGRAVTLSSQVERWPGRIDVYRPVPPYDGGLASQDAVRAAGEPYGWGSLGMATLRRFLRTALTDDGLNGGVPFCSQLVSRAARVGGRDPRPGLADCCTEPGHLAKPYFSEPLFRLYWEKGQIS